DREAREARAEVVGDKAPNDKGYDRARHAQEIERAENIAAGLPPEGLPPAEESHGEEADKSGNFREPNLDTPAQVAEEKPFHPVHIPQRPQGIVEALRVAATTVIKKVQRLIKPVK